MLIRPSEGITEDLSKKIEETRIEGRSSCLDQPKIVAEHLKTKEDLDMFYAEERDAGGLALVLTAAKTAIALGALVIGLAATGASPYLSSEMDNLALAEVDNLNVNDLLKARCDDLLAT